MHSLSRKVNPLSQTWDEDLSVICDAFVQVSLVSIPKCISSYARHAPHMTGSIIFIKIKVLLHGHAFNPGHSYCLGLQIRIFKFSTKNMYIYLFYVER